MCQGFGRVCRSEVYLRRLLIAAIRIADGKPLVVSYQADGTPALTRVTRVIRLPSGRKVRRTGGKSVEFYLERATVMSWDEVGRPRAVVLARDARPMPDRSWWPSYAAAVRFCPLARQQGHTGIVLHHYAFDRGQLFLPLSRTLRARHKLYISKQVPEQDQWQTTLGE